MVSLESLISGQLNNGFEIQVEQYKRTDVHLFTKLCVCVCVCV